MCLVMLPDSHALAKHVQRASNRYVRCHRAPLHEVMHAFDLQLKEYEKIRPMWFGSKWGLGIEMQMLEDMGQGS